MEDSSIKEAKLFLTENDEDSKLNKNDNSNNNIFDDFTALATFLERNGAIYLPAAGYHEVTSGKMKVKSINSSGYYWLSTYYNDVAACCWYISGSSGIDVKFKARSLGYSVRLAR